MSAETDSSEDQLAGYYYLPLVKCDTLVFRHCLGYAFLIHICYIQQIFMILMISSFIITSPETAKVGGHLTYNASKLRMS